MDVFERRLQDYCEAEKEREFRAQESKMRLQALREGRHVAEVHSLQEVVEAARYAADGTVIILV